MESSFSATHKALKGVDYELEMLDAVTVELPGVDLIEYATNYMQGIVGNIVINEIFVFGTDVVDFNIPLGTAVFYPQTPDTTTILSSENAMIEAVGNSDANISLQLTVNFVNELVSIYKVSYEIYLYEIGGAKTLLFATTDYRAGVEHEVRVNIEQPFNLVAGKFYVLGSQILLSTPEVYDERTPLVKRMHIIEGIAKVSINSTTEPVQVKALRAKQVFDKLIDKISPDTPTQSNLLDNSNLLIMSGDAIRGIIGAKMITNFNDFYQSMDAVYCAGFSPNNNKAVIEKRDYFFRTPYVMADLGEVKDLVIKPFTEFLSSSIKAGYIDSSYEVENGRFEFNSEQTWKTTSKRVSKNLDITSKYRADQFGMEELRLKQLATSTANDTDTDTENDNTIFMLLVHPEPIDDIYYPITSADFVDTSGFVSRTTTYNIGLSPKHNMLNHIGFIASSFHGVNENGNIEFTSGKKNTDISANDGTNIVVENAPIYIKDVANRYFLPFECTFKAKYPKNIQELIQTSPDGVIQFTYNNNMFYGFILEVSTDLAKNTEQEFRLLLSTNNILKNLI